MIADHISRIRSAVAGLDRSTLRQVAKDIGADRDDLSDFADVGTPLTPDQLTKLAAWHELFALRQALNDPTRLVQLASICEATGVARKDYDGFVAGIIDLPPWQKDMLKSFLIGGYGLTSSGKYLPAIPPAPAIPFGTVNGEMPPGIKRRGDAMRKLQALPIEELERLVALARLPMPA